MNLNKRIEKLESVIPKRAFKNLAELMQAEATPGTPEHKELKNLYNENRTHDEHIKTNLTA